MCCFVPLPTTILRHSTALFTSQLFRASRLPYHPSNLTGPPCTVCNSRCLVQYRLTVPLATLTKVPPAGYSCCVGAKSLSYTQCDFQADVCLVKTQFKEIGTVCLVSRLCCISDKIFADLQEKRDIAPSKHCRHLVYRLV